MSGLSTPAGESAVRHPSIPLSLHPTIPRVLRGSWFHLAVLTWAWGVACRETGFDRAGFKLKRAIRPYEVMKMEEKRIRVAASSPLFFLAFPVSLVHPLATQPS